MAAMIAVSAFAQSGSPSSGTNDTTIDDQIGTNQLTDTLKWSDLKGQNVESPTHEKLGKLRDLAIDLK